METGADNFEGGDAGAEGAAAAESAAGAAGAFGAIFVGAAAGATLAFGASGALGAFISSAFRVTRTVSFFNGTADVLVIGFGGFESSSLINCVCKIEQRLQTNVPTPKFN